MAQATTDTTVLVVDDDPVVRGVLNDTLEQNGFAAIIVDNEADGLDIARRHRPDLIIMDMRKPPAHGHPMLASLRSDRLTGEIPVIVLTAQDAESDRVSGLEMGADDYVIKPFSPRELIARVRTILRRSVRIGHTNRTLEHGPFRIDSERRNFWYSGQPVVLTATEFRLMESLLRNVGKVLSRDELSLLARDVGLDPHDRTIDTHIKSLRRKLGAGADAIRTVRGFGYKLE